MDEAGLAAFIDRIRSRFDHRQHCVAAVVAWLARPDAGWVTGQNIRLRAVGHGHIMLDPVTAGLSTNT